MRTFTVPAAGVLLVLVAGATFGTASAQTAAPQRAAPPAPQGANLLLPGQPSLDDTAKAANLWINQVIGKILEGPEQDRSGPARPDR